MFHMMTTQLINHVGTLSKQIFYCSNSATMVNLWTIIILLSQ